MTIFHSFPTAKQKALAGPCFYVQLSSIFLNTGACNESHNWPETPFHLYFIQTGISPLYQCWLHPPTCCDLLTQFFRKPLNRQNYDFSSLPSTDSIHAAGATVKSGKTIFLSFLFFSPLLLSMCWVGSSHSQ